MSGFNPYQPPAHPEKPVFEPSTRTPAGEPLDWEIGSALSVGWDRTKLWWPVLVFGTVIVQVITQGVSYGLQSVQAGLSPGGAAIVGLLNAVLSLVLGAFFGVGLIRVFLQALRGQAPKFDTIFSGGDRMLPLIGTQFLMGLAIAGGLILLIVPGFILALGLSLASYLCVDEELAPVDALKRSWEMMKGSKGQLFGFGFVSLFVAALGLLALFFGVFVSLAVISAGMAWIYLRLRGEAVPERLS